MERALHEALKLGNRIAIMRDGARGLGLEVLLAINRIEVGRGFEAGLSIVLLAIIIDRITQAMAARQQYTVTT